MRILATLSIIFTLQLCLNAQDVMMQGWYWDYPKTCNGFNWADTLTSKLPELSTAGITHLWLPPASRASFGDCSNGYDPQDLYDLGEFGLGPTGFGSRPQVDALITNASGLGMDIVADVVYNHRDGGDPEPNPAVKDYITIHYDASKSAFPSDRFRCVLPLGGSSGNDAGDYYFKISSKSQDPKFYNKPYTFLAETSIVGFQGLPALSESEPNGGGDCSQPFNTVPLGVDMDANIDATGCLTDEFKITIGAGDFNAAGDELIIYLTNPNGDYSDHRIYGIWNASAGQDVVTQLVYETYTDFTNMPSGQGGMNYTNFKPNYTTSPASSTALAGDWDWLWFFYDYDQYVPDTRTKLFDWTKWLWTDPGFRGFRMDAVKHFDPSFIGDLMDELHDVGYDPGMVVGEVFDGNEFVLQNWLNGVRASMDADTDAAIKVKVFDFAVREALKNSCDLFGYDVRNVFNRGIVDGAGDSGFHSVTFVNNHDFRGPGEPIQNDAMLGYAYILTNNQIGVPCIFYPDYYGASIPNSPTQNLQSDIDQLIAIHQDYIFGSTSVDYLSRFSTPYSASYSSGYPNTTLMYQLSGGIGGKEVIVVINFAGEDLILSHEVNAVLPIGETMTELTGNAYNSQTTINPGNTMDISLPARSYGVWVNGGCLQDLTLDQLPVSQGTYEVIDYINSSGTIANGTQVNYRGGNEINLLDGFETFLGSIFCADINPCTP